MRTHDAPNLDYGPDAVIMTGLDGAQLAPRRLRRSAAATRR